MASENEDKPTPSSVDRRLTLPQGSTNLEAIQVIKKPGGSLKDSFLDEGLVCSKWTYTVMGVGRK